MAEKALEVKATATVDGSSVHPTSVTVINSINNMAQGQITYIHKSADANNKATEITSQDIFEAMGKRQENSFKDAPDATTATLSMTDAYGGSASIKGTTSAPNYSFSVSDVSLTEDIQPAYAALNSFDMSCYPLGKEDIDATLDELPSTIASCIKKCFEQLIETGKEALEQVEDSQSKAKAQIQDKINDKVKKYAIELFTNSEDTMGWDGAVSSMQDGGGGTNNLLKRINIALSSRTGGFFNNIIRLCEEFQCVYVPELDNVGKLVNRRDLFKNSEDLKLHIMSLSARAGSVGMFPIRAVAVAGVGYEDVDLVNTADVPLFHSMYPDDVTPGGSIATVQGPQWVPESQYDAEDVPEVKDGNSDAGPIQANALDSSTAKNKSTVKQQVEKSKESQDNLLRQWSESAYYWQALGQSYAIINTELCLNAKVGTRYKVKGDKGQLFTGILNSVNHTITTGYDSCKAVSNLQFSHVIMGSASIPGIK